MVGFSVGNSSRGSGLYVVVSYILPHGLGLVVGL